MASFASACFMGYAPCLVISAESGTNVPYSPSVSYPLRSQSVCDYSCHHFIECTHRRPKLPREANQFLFMRGTHIYGMSGPTFVTIVFHSVGRKITIFLFCGKASAPRRAERKAAYTTSRKPITYLSKKIAHTRTKMLYAVRTQFPKHSIDCWAPDRLKCKPRRTPEDGSAIYSFWHQICRGFSGGCCCVHTIYFVLRVYYTVPGTNVSNLHWIGAGAYYIQNVDRQSKYKLPCTVVVMGVSNDCCSGFSGKWKAQIAMAARSRATTNTDQKQQ